MMRQSRHVTGCVLPLVLVVFGLTPVVASAQVSAAGASTTTVVSHTATPQDHVWLPDRILDAAPLPMARRTLVRRAERQTILPPEEPDAWHFAVGATLFAMDIDAVTTLGVIETPAVEVPFSALVSQLKAIVPVHVEGLTGPYGFGVDFLYAKVGKGGIDTPIPGITVNDISLAITDFQWFGVYRLGRPTDTAGSLDILGGARYRRLNLELDVRGLPMPVSGGFDNDWWDVLAGGRWIKQVHPRVGLTFRADAGAGVVNVQGGVGFKVANPLVLLVEYRYLNWDHEQGSGRDFFAYDGTEQGPYLATVYTF